VKGMHSYEGLPFNYPMRAHIRDSSTDPSYPSRLLKLKGKTRHFVPFRPFTNPSPEGNRQSNSKEKQ
jgi:hypothetical protein